MYKNILSSIPGIELYPILALVLFFGFFSALIYWFFVVDKQRMTTLSAGILEEDMPATSSHLHHPIEGELP
jgi:hypothetical protein